MGVLTAVAERQNLVDPVPSVRCRGKIVTTFTFTITVEVHPAVIVLRRALSAACTLRQVSTLVEERSSARFVLESRETTHSKVANAFALYVDTELPSSVSRQSIT